MRFERRQRVAGESVWLEWRFLLRAAVVVLGLVAPVQAEGWRPLDSAGIKAALAARVLGYPDGATQDLFQDGRTLYLVGDRASWGRWWVEDDRYCSSWPPSDVAACYLIAVQGLDVRFTGSDGSVTVGRYQDL